MAKELEKNYNPADIEKRTYDKWLEKKYFHAEVDRDKKPFTIVMPPPNITGQLHMGHALDNTMQDILTRFKRMQGYEALWLPGTDHASIATEAKIVEKMREEGITKEDIGREKFLDRAWQWKAQYGGRIVSQLKKIGSSCDWDRERFTMDEGCSKAVKEVFVNLYNKGQIYRGERIINWCPHCRTSLSDAEVEYEEQAGHFWHLRYQLSDKSIVRAFKNRKNINRVILENGNYPENDNEIILEKRYCAEHNISIGDTITLGSDTFKVVGTGCVSDYNAPYKNISDSIVDSKQFGMAFLTENAYNTLKENNLSMKTEEYTYAYTLNDNITDSELKELMRNFN